MTDTPRYRILIIDDEPNLLLGLSRRLERAGYQTFTANNGAEGLKLALQNHPDIILSDVGMPPPNGFDLRRDLSTLPDTVNIPFIFLTARASPGDKVHGLELGADDYITKPFDIQELLARVQAVLRRSEKARQTALAEAEEQMEKVKRAISANLSHEMRTPLGVIMMSLETAVRQNPGQMKPEDWNWYLQSALNSAERLKQLVNDMVMLNAIDQGSLSTFRQRIDPQFDIDQPVRRCVNFWKKDLKLEVAVDPQVVIFAPRMEFTQCVIHLVDNACKFSPEGGTVQVKVEPNGEGGCVVTVRDEGPGIPAEYRRQVFERFFQISRGDTRLYGGLGIGLYLVQAVATALHGSASVLDTPNGCTIQLILPPGQLDWRE